MNKKLPPHLSVDLKKLQETLADAARIGAREVQRGVDYARRNLEKVQLVQRRKDLFSELGRNLYDAYVDGLPPEVARFLDETEFSEIIGEIRGIDDELARRTEKA